MLADLLFKVLDNLFGRREERLGRRRGGLNLIKILLAFTAIIRERAQQDDESRPPTPCSEGSPAAE